MISCEASAESGGSPEKFIKTADGVKFFRTSSAIVFTSYIGLLRRFLLVAAKATLSVWRVHAVCVLWYSLSLFQEEGAQGLAGPTQRSMAAYLPEEVTMEGGDEVLVVGGVECCGGWFLSGW